MLALSSSTVQGASEKTRAAESQSSADTSPDAAADTAPQIALSSDPQDALDQLADADRTVDQSRISNGPCGMFALTVGPLGLRSYEWIDGQWTSMFGAVLDESGCSWRWVTFVTPNGPSQTVRNLVWDDNELWFNGSAVYENQGYPVIAQHGTYGAWYADFR